MTTRERSHARQRLLAADKARRLAEAIRRIAELERRLAAVEAERDAARDYNQQCRRTG
jgi:hypothetical protein